jgi:hypothetical protein
MSGLEYRRNMGKLIRRKLLQQTVGLPLQVSTGGIRLAFVIVPRVVAVQYDPASLHAELPAVVFTVMRNAHLERGFNLIYTNRVCTSQETYLISATKRTCFNNILSL